MTTIINPELVLNNPALLSDLNEAASANGFDIIDSKLVYYCPYTKCTFEGYLDTLKENNNTLEMDCALVFEDYKYKFQIYGSEIWEIIFKLKEYYTSDIEKKVILEYLLNNGWEKEPLSFQDWIIDIYSRRYYTLNNKLHWMNSFDYEDQLRIINMYEKTNNTGSEAFKKHTIEFYFINEFISKYKELLVNLGLQ